MLHVRNCRNLQVVVKESLYLKLASAILIMHDLDQTGAREYCFLLTEVLIGILVRDIVIELDKVFPKIFRLLRD